MRRIILGLVLPLLATPLALGQVPTYSTFELQARSNIVDGFNLPPNSSFNSKTPALNDDGTIAFSLISVGGQEAGLFVGSGGTGSVVYEAPSELLLEDPSINAAGQVAFDLFDIFSEGNWVYDPTDGQTEEAIPATTFDIATSAGITSSGAIGYRASFSGGAQSWRLWSGSETTYVAEGGGIAFLFTPSTNAPGRIAGKVRLGSTAGSAPDEIRVYQGPGSFAIVARDVNALAGSPYAGFDNSVDLTDDGKVAFVADMVSGDRGVFLTDGTTTVTIAVEADDEDDVTDISFFPPAANDDGLVAFRGLDAAGFDAIFVGDGTTLRKIVREHDVVPTDLGPGRIDQHDSSVVFGGAVAINASGDVAFHAALAPPDNPMIEWGSGMFVAYADPVGNGSPPPVPDGRTVPGAQMTATRAANNFDVVLTWDAASCPGDEYNVFFGPLGSVSTLTITAAHCSLGTTGTATARPPVGSVFFLVASEDDEGVESGHGYDSTGAPRFSMGTGFCGVTAQALDGECR
jgi:hypothetical protein